MTPKLIAIAALALAAGALFTLARAQDQGAPPAGAYYSHLTEERTDIAVGVTRAGDYVSEKRRVEVRESVIVPAHFGSLVGITQAGARTVLWFQGEGGAIRNVSVADADSRLYRIEPNGSRLVEEIRYP